MESSRLDKLYQGLADWLTDINNHEVKSLVEFIEQAKSVVLAAEAIPENKVKQFLENLDYDLHELYQQNQQEIQHSIYLALLNERFWSLMVNITDQAQVEWAELCEDFQHNGDYKTGDVIGFGFLVCKQCHQSLTITHQSIVNDCFACGHNHFSRQSLTSQ